MMIMMPLWSTRTAVSHDLLVLGWQTPPLPQRHGLSAGRSNESTMRCSSNNEILFADQQLPPPPCPSQRVVIHPETRRFATSTDIVHSRRHAVQQATESIAQALLVGGTAWSTASNPARAAAVVEPSAATSSSSSSSFNEQVNVLLQKLHDIPTFCIVRSDTGAAYMAYQSDLNMAVGYAFVTFPGAVAVLKDAQKVAQQKGYYDTWEAATVTTIPLDIAVRLALKKRSRTSQKSQSLDTLLQIIPGAVRRQR
jgi:hypothetical protein